MATQRQIEANRRNAKKSTGPRTAAGKVKAAQNAIKHGLFSDKLLIRFENKEDFYFLRDQLLEALQPEGALELFLASRIVTLAWRLKRLGQTEQEMVTTQLVDLYYFVNSPYCDEHRARDEANYRAMLAAKAAGFADDDLNAPAPRVFEVLTLGDCLTRSFDTNSTFEKFSRYESHLEQCFRRTLHEYQRVQTMRKGQAVVTPIAVDLSLDGTAA